MHMLFRFWFFLVFLEKGEERGKKQEKIRDVQQHDAQKLLSNAWKAIRDVLTSEGIHPRQVILTLTQYHPRIRHFNQGLCLKRSPTGDKTQASNGTLCHLKKKA